MNRQKKCYTSYMKQGIKTKRHILEQSDKLFYKNGYAHTSFTDIMHATGLSKGNITYHFKSKRAILEGIVAMRMEQIESNFAKWEAHTNNPLERLMLFCEMIINEQENIVAFGCPMGTLTAEFAKNEPELYTLAQPMFEAYKQWLAKTFDMLGSNASEEEAMSLLGNVQGVAMVAHVFKDKMFLHREIEQIKANLRSKYATTNS